MAVIDYIHQQETVLKKDFESWLIAKMQAVGWQQVGSNPPQTPNDATTSRFYVMKGKRASDNMDTFVAINGRGIRATNNASYSAHMALVPLLDYTPGAAGTTGTTSKGTQPFNAVTGVLNNNPWNWSLFGIYNSSLYPADTPLNVRFCITAHNVSLVVRVPNFYGEKGGYVFFGLPDVLTKEKNSGITTVTGSINGASSNSQFFVADTPLNIPSSVPTSAATSYETLISYGFTPPKSPDVNGNFPFMLVYGGDATSGLRLRHPSAFFVRPGGLLDGDLIMVDGMTFEILEPQYLMGGNFLSGYIAYRIA